MCVFGGVCGCVVVVVVVVSLCERVWGVDGGGGGGVVVVVVVVVFLFVLVFSCCVLPNTGHIRKRYFVDKTWNLKTEALYNSRLC